MAPEPEGHFKWTPKELLLPCSVRMGGQRSCFTEHPPTSKEDLTMTITHILLEIFFKGKNLEANTQFKLFQLLK